MLRVAMRWLALQLIAQAQTAALVDTVPIHLVEQRSQAHAEPLRGGATVAPRRRQGGRNRLTLRRLHSLSERPRACARAQCRGGACADPGRKPGVERQAEIHGLRSPCRSAPPPARWRAPAPAR